MASRFILLWRVKSENDSEPAVGVSRAADSEVPDLRGVADVRTGAEALVVVAHMNHAYGF